MMEEDNNSSISGDVIEASLAEKLSIDKVVNISNSQAEYYSFLSESPDNGHALLLLSLTNEEFTEDEAEHLWVNIQHHRKSMTQLLKRDVGISVAALDYMTNIKNVMSDPVLIEESKSNDLAEIATNDLLTGLLTRDIFDVIYSKEISITRRNEKLLSLAMIDIDDFKKINDDYGHQAGDKVLSVIGDMINKGIRDMDVAARYGGEELVILMPDTAVETAYDVANRIRGDIEKTIVDSITITVSIGVSEFDHDDESDDLIKKADEALYKAKSSGKNAVVKAIG